MFNNSSVGPFICRQLIQRLVSSNPSPGYLHRVVQKFNDDGSAQHVRGNMQAVIKAILLDGEARNPAALTNTSGKQREHLLRLTGPARAFPITTSGGSYSQSGGNIMTITTTTPHLLAGGNAVSLDFTGNTPIPFYNPSTSDLQRPDLTRSHRDHLRGRRHQLARRQLHASGWLKHGHRHRDQRHESSRGNEALLPFRHRRRADRSYIP